MRAFAVQKFHEAPAIHELPIPAADSAFLIRVRYAGVNPLDYKVVEQLTAASPYPFVMGIDFAGGVERALEWCAQKFYDISLETHSEEDILIVHFRHRAI
jgi:NADPH:quinone reductase-like Zn-dependent oxidoreductase